MPRQISFAVNHALSLFDGGPYSISGTTKNTGTPTNVPVRRRVRLHDQPTGRALREVWSDALTGAWTFANLRAGLFFVMTLDHTGTHNGEITTDIVVPAP
jgi:hypothetical protein